MEDIRIVFSNIMEKLLKQAHKNKNVLEYKEINDAFKNIELTPESGFLIILKNRALMF